MRWLEKEEHDILQFACDKIKFRLSKVQSQLEPEDYDKYESRLKEFYQEKVDDKIFKLKDVRTIWGPFSDKWTILQEAYITFNWNNENT